MTNKTKSRPSKKTGERKNSELQDITLLGQQHNHVPNTYAPQILEAFENKNPKDEAWTSFVCTEFSSLCPKTAQPDFARVFINYIANKKMVESKSLKLYLFSFRNHGDFHEDCIQKICNDLNNLMDPRYIEVIGEFTPRGGISIFPFTSACNGQKKYLSLKQQRFANYSPSRYTCSLKRLYGG